MSASSINHLKELESEAIFVIREVASEFEKPVLLFSGGKDSIILTHLAKKAFYPAKIPFPLLHIDTGHNFEETIAFRDELVTELGVTLLVGSVQKSIDEGKVVEEKGINASRITLQTTTLLEALEENNFDAAIGGAEEMKKKPGQKSVSFHIEMISVSGIQRINDLNCGISSIPKRI